MRRYVLRAAQRGRTANGLIRHWFARKDAQSTRERSRQRIEKCFAVRREQALLQTYTVREDSGHGWCLNRRRISYPGREERV
jgi:hypothetical protein